MRSARIRTWAADSSPVTTRLGASVRAAFAATSSSSVDLPTPGSPASSTTAPGHEAAAQHPVQLADAGRSGLRCGRVDLGDRSRYRAHRAGDRGQGRRSDLGHRSPGLALRAAPDPARDRQTALTAPVRRPLLDTRLRHAADARGRHRQSLGLSDRAVSNHAMADKPGLTSVRGGIPVSAGSAGCGATSSGSSVRVPRPVGSSE